jgi:hypothetical protein
MAIPISLTKASHLQESLRSKLKTVPLRAYRSSQKSGGSPLSRAITSLVCDQRCDGTPPRRPRTTITAHEVDLMHAVPTEGLEESAVVAMRKFRDHLCRGENTKAAALATAGYSLFDVQAALAKQDREDMRAFEALLGRPTWRRRIVLWLLGGRAEQ